MFYTMDSILQRYSNLQKNKDPNISAKKNPCQEFQDAFEALLKELLEKLPQSDFGWAGPMLTGLGLGSAAFVPAAITSAIGFSGAGVVAGSLAAGWQASIGNVVAGSTFASLQSAGATGLLFPPLSLVAGIGALGAGSFFGTKYLILKQRKHNFNKKHQDKLEELHKKLELLENCIQENCNNSQLQL
eukprot:TRINITY_DN1330_c0_g1_i4.p2 TRINITY_DN1330_c0_g1~~TRINITY_DN1330_c0_g1_i4.p2  ORF type:complete len:187 (-),score=23.56 TRINITY_DN1330_c0_g1_i4:482-1042(-)